MCVSSDGRKRSQDEDACVMCCDRGAGARVDDGACSGDESVQPLEALGSWSGASAWHCMRVRGQCGCSFALVITLLGCTLHAQRCEQSRSILCVTAWQRRLLAGSIVLAHSAWNVLLQYGRAVFAC